MRHCVLLGTSTILRCEDVFVDETTGLRGSSVAGGVVAAFESAPMGGWRENGVDRNSVAMTRRFKGGDAPLS